jgi:hypothetical protein
MHETRNPKWWTTQNDSAWERVKAAFKRDWDQTKHDVGGKQPDTNQGVSDTVKQASGKEAIPPRGVPNYEDAEVGYRFGYGARSKYGTKYRNWEPGLERQLEADWSETYGNRNWPAYHDLVRRGWDYEESERHERERLNKAA